MKKANYTTDTSLEDLREYKISIRLNAEEKEFLQQKAEDLGCSLSQALRIILFSKKRGSEAENLTTSDFKKNQLVALNSIKTSFRKIADGYTTFVSDYHKALSTKRRDGEPSVSTEGTLFAITTLHQSTLALQGDLNKLLKKSNINELHKVTPLPSDLSVGGKDDENSDDNNNLIYYYMQKITIAGVLRADAEQYTNEKNEDCMRFCVLCESFSGNKRTTTQYQVYNKMSKVFQYLKKDKQVMVVGELSTRATQDKEGRPVVILNVLCDSLVLGK